MTTEDDSHALQCRKYSPLAWTLFFIVVVSMLMGTGPGVLLVNQPTTIGGLPLVYVWGICWYLVLVAVALVAYFILWKNDAAEAESLEVTKPSRDQ